MRVGIDATVVAQSQTTGIGRLIYNLVTALAETDADHEFTLLYRPRSLKEMRQPWRPMDPRFRTRLMPRLAERFVLPRFDVVHSTYQRLPAYHGITPYLGTLHDIFFASQHASAVEVATRDRWVARYRDVVERSRLIMTLSDYSKRQIVALLGASPDRVRIVAPAAAPVFHARSAAAIATARRRYGLDRPFILFAGGLDPRKNVRGALRAFALATAHLPADVCLAIAGSNDRATATKDMMAEVSADRVRMLGFVPDDDFAALMSGCALFLFPSLFEGFGLPPLEAMACGAVVVASSTTSLPEVCADAGLLADPHDAAALAAAIVRAATDEPLRAHLRERGAQRAKQFSWSTAARQTLALYQETARD